MDGNKCDVCGIEHSSPSLSCPVCNDILKSKTYTKGEMRKALIDSFVCIDEGGNRCFRCHYTGIVSKFDRSFKSNNSSLKRAFDLTFDHVDPTFDSRNGEVVVCLNIINQMKSNMTFYDFKLLVMDLADYFREENEENSRQVEDTIWRIKECAIR